MISKSGCFVARAAHPLLSVLLLLLVVVGTAVQAQQPPSSADYEQPDFSLIPVYDEFFNRPESYSRLHLHVLGVKGDGPFFWNLRMHDAILTVNTYGNDVGSTDYFDVGVYQSNPVKATPRQEYLYPITLKQFLFYKTNGTAGITFTLREDNCIGQDDQLLQFDLPIEEFPAVGEDYVEYTRSSTTSSRLDPVEVVFRLKVTRNTDTYVSEQDLLDMTTNFDSTKYPGIEYKETEFNLTQNTGTYNFQRGGDKFLLQSWKHTDASQVQGAVLWVIGRTDSFMHPHVVETLFFGSTSTYKMDLYVVNWRLNGLAALEKEWLTDPNFWSHNAYGDLDIYDEEMQLAIDAMVPSDGTSTYDKTIAYCHSTGATILFNYFINNGQTNSGFDGIILNSPLLDYDQLVYEELYLEYLVGPLVAVGIWDETQFVQAPNTLPENVTKIEYLGLELYMQSDKARLTTVHPTPWKWRRNYAIANTAGFVQGVSKAFRKFKFKAPLVRDVPVLVLTSSYGDTILDTQDIEEYSRKYVSRDRELVKFKYNYHDVFFAVDYEEEVEAIVKVREWIGQNIITG